ncbi:hypothetical protein K438DRAFT_1749322 [Mycena galopus ATCC 62051]|nr:hypothetical protein K438DRAFT_1749322 [Mycena galopus ATCC 62051]
MVYLCVPLTTLCLPLPFGLPLSTSGYVRWTAFAYLRLARLIRTGYVYAMWTKVDQQTEPRSTHGQNTYTHIPVETVQTQKSRSTKPNECEFTPAEVMKTFEPKSNTIT